MGFVEVFGSFGVELGNSGKKERGITGKPVGGNFFIIIVMIITFMKMFLTEHVTEKKK